MSTNNLRTDNTKNTIKNPILFVVSDVHGNYKALKRALKKAGFDMNDPEHTFISLGNFLNLRYQEETENKYKKATEKDRIKCLEFIDSIPEDRKVLIRGRNEDMFEAALDINDPNYKLYMDYLNSTVNYYENDNSIFVSSWIPVKAESQTKLDLETGEQIYEVISYYNPRWKRASRKDWDAARWADPIAQSESQTNKTKKDIICGTMPAWVCYRVEEIFGRDNQEDQKDLINHEDQTDLINDDSDLVKDINTAAKVTEKEYQAIIEKYFELVMEGKLDEALKDFGDSLSINQDQKFKKSRLDEIYFGPDYINVNGAVDVSGKVAVLIIM